MISIAEHNEIVSRLQRNPRKYERKEKNPLYPLNKTLCECGGKIVGFTHSNGKGGSWPKYRCRMCKQQLHRDTIHENLDSILAKLVLNGDEVEGFVEQLQSVWSQRQRDNLSRVEALKAKLTSLQDTRDKMLETYALSSTEMQADLKAVIDKKKLEIS